MMDEPGLTAYTKTAIAAIRALQKKGLAIDSYQGVSVDDWIDVDYHPATSAITLIARTRVIHHILSESLKAVCDVNDDALAFVLKDDAR